MRINTFYLIPSFILLATASGFFIYYFPNKGIDIIHAEDLETLPASQQVASLVAGLASSSATSTTTAVANTKATGIKPSPASKPARGDLEAPSAPQGLSANPVSSTQINLAWSPASDNKAVAGYRVYRNGVEIGRSVGTKFANINLRPQTDYRFSVAAFDQAGNLSKQSDIIETFTQNSFPAENPALTTQQEESQPPPPTAQQPTVTQTPTVEQPAQTSPPPPPATTAPQTYTVNVYEDGTVDPSSLTIRAGDTVSFVYVNPDDELILLFTSGNIKSIKLDHEKRQKSITFNQAGTYNYSIAHESSGNGVIIVQ